MPYWNADSRYEGLFGKFRLGLQEWCRTGKVPKAGNQDLRYSLELQSKRLKSHDLRWELELQPEDSVTSMHRVSSCLPFGDGFSRFNHSLYTQSVTRRVTYFKGQDRVFSDKRNLTMYQTILDPAESPSGSMPCLCPDCGAISTLDLLQEQGCPYCGTRYLMGDLYPKVTNYYYIDTGSVTDQQVKTHRSRIFILAGILSLIQTAVSTLHTEDFEVFITIFYFLLGMGIWAFVIYFVSVVFLAGKAFFKAGKSVPLAVAAAGSKERIAKELQSVDPAFDYEYFEGKALSLVKIILFSQDPENCGQYQGPAVSDAFHDIVDIQYRGGLGIRDIRITPERVQVGLTLYLTATVCRGKKIRIQDEAVEIDMYHSRQFQVDPAFSIQKVRCSGCGGSFDARKRRICPYCSQPYDVSSDDWMVSRIKR